MPRSFSQSAAEKLRGPRMRPPGEPLLPLPLDKTWKKPENRMLWSDKLLNSRSWQQRSLRTRRYRAYGFAFSSPFTVTVTLKTQCPNETATVNSVRPARLLYLVPVILLTPVMFLLWRNVPLIKRREAITSYAKDFIFSVFNPIRGDHYLHAHSQPEETTSEGPHLVIGFSPWKNLQD